MKADKEIFINVSAGSTRIALTEGGKFVELHIERPDHQRMVGNIFKGKIQNVIPGMQAAFIDIGYDINAFLPFSEIGNSEGFNNLSFDEDDDGGSNSGPPGPSSVIELSQHQKVETQQKSKTNSSNYISSIINHL